MPRGGIRTGQGRPKKAKGYPNEPTSPERIPESVAEELMPLLEAGHQVKVLPKKTYRFLLHFALKGLTVSQESK